MTASSFPGVQPGRPTDDDDVLGRLWHDEEALDIREGRVRVPVVDVEDADARDCDGAVSGCGGNGSNDIGDADGDQVALVFDCDGGDASVLFQHGADAAAQPDGASVESMGNLMLSEFVL